MGNDRFLLLVSRHLAGEANLQEEEELKNLVKYSKEHHLRYEAIVAFWGKSQQRKAIDIENAYQKVITRIKETTPDSKIRTLYSTSIGFWKWRVAATLIIALGIGLYLYSTNTEQAVWVNLTWEVKENSKGERSKITLSDGSTVWLNADSELKYPEKFNNDTREIYLTGEAFFEVAKNPKKPFIIHLEDGVIRVLGTSFNVKAFKGDAVVETSVLTGKVAFIPPQNTPKSKRDTILLTPNYKVVYSKQSKKTNTQKTNGNDDKAWVEGKLIFKSMRFEDIGKELARTFGKNVVFEKEDLKDCRLTGTFQNNSLEEIMNLFAKTKDYEYEISNDNLLIFGSGCSPN